MPGTPLVQMVFARRFIATGSLLPRLSVAACQPNDRAAPPPHPSSLPPWTRQR